MATEDPGDGGNRRLRASSALYTGPARMIMVIGATGRTGSLLTHALAASGAQVAALVRNLARAREALPPNVVLRQGDLRDAASIDAAMTGVHTAIIAVGGTGGEDRGPPRVVDHHGVATCAASAARAGVERIILVSSAGATQPEHPHNCTFGGILTHKFRGENAVRACGVPFTIARALGLRDRPGGVAGLRIVQGDAIAFGEDLARADLAAFLTALAIGDDRQFMPGFDPGSLLGATFELYNDAAVPGGRCASSLARLERG